MGVFLSELANWLWELEEEFCTWHELHHAGDGERRLLVNALVLVTWEVTILFVSVTMWIRGVCQHIDTTGKNPVVSCPSLYIQALTLLKFFMCLILETIT